MGRKNKHFKSVKECENIHVFMENWYGVKSHHRRRTRFHHNDLGLYLQNRGITPPRSIDLNIAEKENPNAYIYIRDDDNNIRCYENVMRLNSSSFLANRPKEEELLEKRRACLRSSGYDYDPCTGEVDTIEHLNYLEWLYGLEPTEKVNRQEKQRVKRY